MKLIHKIIVSILLLTIASEQISHVFAMDHIASKEKSGHSSRIRIEVLPSCLEEYQKDVLPAYKKERLRLIKWLTIEGVVVCAAIAGTGASLGTAAPLAVALGVTISLAVVGTAGSSASLTTHLKQTFKLAKRWKHNKEVMNYLLEIDELGPIHRTPKQNKIWEENLDGRLCEQNKHKNLKKWIFANIKTN